MMTSLLESDTSDMSSGNPREDSILQRIAAGEPKAVDECLDVYGGLIWSMARRWFKNASDAEDATQDVFIELWQCADRFDPTKTSESAFITMIGRRRLIDRIRRSRTQPNAVSFDASAMEAVENPTRNVSELVDEAAKAARCLERLSNDQQRILTLSIHNGASHGTISQALGIPLGTVKSFARRGLIQLRDCMQRTQVQVSGSAT